MKRLTVLWDDYNANADAEALLQAHGWTRANERSGRVYYTRPGKSAADGISGNWHTDMRLFYVFTDATQFSPDRAYNPAQLLCALEFGGDMRATARHLIELGYYTPKELSIVGRVRLEI